MIRIVIILNKYKYKASTNKRARISSLFIDEENKEHVNVFPKDSVQKRSNTFTHLDEINKHEQNTEEYVTFIDKEKMEEEQMMNYYKHLRKEISMKLKEIDLACDYKEKKKNVLLKHKKSTKGRNSYGNISLTKKPPTNSNIFLHASGTIANTTNNTLSNHNIFKKSSQYVSMYPYIKKVSSFHEMKVPVAEPSFPFSEENNKEHVTVNKYKKSKGNKLGIVKIYDKYNKINHNNIKSNHFLTQQIFTPNKTMSNNDNSTKKYDSPISMYKFREITPDKWLSPNGFIV